MDTGLILLLACLFLSTLSVINSIFAKKCQVCETCLYTQPECARCQTEEVVVPVVPASMYF